METALGHTQKPTLLVSSCFVLVHAEKDTVADALFGGDEPTAVRCGSSATADDVSS